MAKKQGAWTRIRPLQYDEVDPCTRDGMEQGKIKWGLHNNLCKVMAYLPRMLQTEVEYANTFIFDPPSFRGAVQDTGFNDRYTKELIIAKVSMINRSRYSITHHSYIAMLLFKAAGLEKEGLEKLLNVLDHRNAPPKLFTQRELLILDYAEKLTKDAHTITDVEFNALRSTLRAEASADSTLLQRLGTDPKMLERHVDSQIVEITWLVGHFCLLNRFFTVLQVPDETGEDEDNFTADCYTKEVPESLRRHNDRVLAGEF